MTMSAKGRGRIGPATKTAHFAARGATDASSDRSISIDPTFEKETAVMTGCIQQTLLSLSLNPFGAVAAVVGAVVSTLIPRFEQEKAASGAAATEVRETGRNQRSGHRRYGITSCDNRRYGHLT
jgi:hypothetical protein